MGLFDKIKKGLLKTRENVVDKIGTMLKSFTKIDEELFEELEEILVLGDVGINTSKKICETLRDTRRFVHPNQTQLPAGKSVDFPIG